MADGQALRVMKVRHNFEQDWDDQHPVCPLRAYHDVEIHDVWSLPTKKPRRIKVANRALGKTTAASGKKPNVAAGGKISSAALAPEPRVTPVRRPASSVFAGDLDEQEGRRQNVHDWMRGAQPLVSSTPAVGGTAVEAKLSYVLSNKVRDIGRVPGNIQDAGASIRKTRLFSFSLATPVEFPTSWGPEVEWQLYHYKVRPVYLYLTNDAWIAAVGKGEGEMPTTLMIIQKSML